MVLPTPMGFAAVRMPSERSLNVRDMVYDSSTGWRQSPYHRSKSCYTIVSRAWCCWMEVDSGSNQARKAPKLKLKSNFVPTNHPMHYGKAPFFEVGEELVLKSSSSIIIHHGTQMPPKHPHITPSASAARSHHSLASASPPQPPSP